MVRPKLGSGEGAAACTATARVGVRVFRVQAVWVGVRGFRVQVVRVGVSVGVSGVEGIA